MSGHITPEIRMLRFMASDPAPHKFGLVYPMSFRALRTDSAGKTRQCTINAFEWRRLVSDGLVRGLEITDAGRAALATVTP